MTSDRRSDIPLLAEEGWPKAGVVRPAKLLILLLAVFILASLAMPIVAQISQEKIDLDAIYRIKDEGLNRSQVMETASYLTDVYGARLTGSPQIKAAAEWTQKKLNEW